MLFKEQNMKPIKMNKSKLLFLLIIIFKIGDFNSQNKNQSHKKNQKTNVILIMADDMGIGDLSSLNNGLNNTTSLNTLKNESLFFKNAYSSSTVCAPARAALLTGMYPHRTGVVSLNSETDSKEQFDVAEKYPKKVKKLTILLDRWTQKIEKDRINLKD
jgi:arylsulfatase A